MRLLLIAILSVGQLFGNCGASTMNDPPLAPSTPGADEQAVTDHTGFEKCEAAVALLADKMHIRITDRAYTESKRWGKVLRARAIATREGGSVAPIVTCWTGAGPEIGISFDFAVPDLDEPRATTK